MYTCDYYPATDLEETLNELADNKHAMVLAGGTDLLPRIRSKDIAPPLLIDIHRLPFGRIVKEDSVIRIGALVTISELLSSLVLKQSFPAIIEAAEQIAGPPIRNRATVAGNLVNASPAADLAPPLLIYNSSLLLRSKNGDRIVPLCDFFVGPGKTLLESGELVVEIQLRPPELPTASKFLKFGKRRAMAISVASTAVSLSLDEAGLLCNSRIALGSVAPKPIRSYQAESILNGSRPSETAFKTAAEMAIQDADPITDIRATREFRQHIVGVLVRRALESGWSELEEKVRDGRN